MKLNKKLGFIASLIVAMMPKGSKADLFLCAACPAGTYGKGDSLNCTPCPVGQYQDIVGQGSCKSCPVGKYQDKTGQGSCITCPMGQYQDKTGQSSCKTCSGTAASFKQCGGLYILWIMVNGQIVTRAYPCSERYKTEKECKEAIGRGCKPEYMDTMYLSNPSRTGCTSIGEMPLDYFTQIASGTSGSSSCPTGTLQPGWYLVRLRGGSGGGGDHDGASLKYIFYIPSTATYQICAGGDGGGGGGGSWLKLNFGGKDYYFVAGGASGGGRSTGETTYDGSGGGGGIGGGGAAGSIDFAPSGGRSGPYEGGTTWSGAGGLYQSGRTGRSCGGFASGGSGGGGGGWGGDGSTTQHNIPCEGPDAPKITINIITGYNTTGTKTGGFGDNTSHESNALKIPDCGSSCAILYKLK